MLGLRYKQATRKIKKGQYLLTNLYNENRDLDPPYLRGEKTGAARKQQRARPRVQGSK